MKIDLDMNHTNAMMSPPVYSPRSNSSLSDRIEDFENGQVIF